MKYGKLENGVFVKAPEIIKIEGKVIYQPDNNTYIKYGYKPIQTTPYPELSEEFIYYIDKYMEEDTQIIQIWSEVTEEIETSIISHLEINN